MARPKIRWSELGGATVGLWGLGVEGAANRRRLEQLGSSVVAVDDHPPPGGWQGLDVRATSEGGLAALAACDVVVKTPGISRYRPEVGRLQAAGVPVTGGLGLWMEEADQGRVVCITGTKGKSTTAAIAGHLLTRLGYPCMVGGNIGRPPWDPQVEAGGHPLWVVETSSFQATDLTSSPPIVAVTSLHPDHLDWHGDAETYFADKLSSTSQAGADLTIAGDSDLLRRHGALLGPRVHWVGDDGDGGAGDWTGALGVVGPHNRRNARVAQAVLRALEVPEADDPGSLARAALGFEPLGSRLQPIGSVGGVTFVDDGLSTNVLATLAALDAFPGRRVALLVGGFDRGIDYRPLGVGLARREVDTLVVTMPDNGALIGRVVAGTPGLGAEVLDRNDLASATAAAFAWARDDGVVLLSPAAPSFGRFADYRQRGAAFAAAMRQAAEAAGRPVVAPAAP